jgi:hypothetical protein
MALLFDYIVVLEFSDFLSSASNLIVGKASLANSTVVDFALLVSNEICLGLC